MNIVDICKLKYPGEVEAGNITFGKPADEILIQYWNVDGVEQPTEAALLADIPTYESTYIDNERKATIDRELPSLEDMVNAMWDSIVSSDNTKLDAVEALRQAVFAAHPAP